MSHHGGPGVGSEIAGRTPGFHTVYSGLDTTLFETGDVVLQWIAQGVLSEDCRTAATVAPDFTKVYLQ